MSGDFHHSNITMFVLSLLAISFGIPIAAAAVDAGRGQLTSYSYHTAAALIMYFMFLCFALLLLSIYVPCTYSADDNGVKIRCGLLTRRYAYTDIRSVSTRTYPDGHSRCGGTDYSAELILVTDSGEKSYVMALGRFYTEDALRDPVALQARIDDNDFTRLAEYISKRI